MQILIVNAQLNTIIFSAFFWGAVIFSIRKPKSPEFFAPFRTTEMKGFAILAIIFSHIGYFLVDDHNFLWPMSVLAGVGVNLFLFLSGLGLTLSSIRKPLPIHIFYYKRLKKLFIPLWIVVTFLLIFDFFYLNRTYGTYEISRSFLGFFPVADLFNNLNSPLWYFTLILFYYLIFPLTFFKRAYYLSPVLILILTFLVLKINFHLGINKDVLDLYKTHFAAFPIGVLFALLISEESIFILKSKFKELFLSGRLKYFWVTIFLFLFGYFSINSGVGRGKNIEQTISLITMFSIVFLFIIKNFEIKLFTFFGIYSYEIYLVHWPLLSRYDFLYKYLPAWMATVFYLILFLGIGFGLHKLTKRLDDLLIKG